jgi:hypothetical protein
MKKDKYGKTVTLFTLIKDLDKLDIKNIIQALQKDAIENKYIKDNETLSKDDIKDIISRDIWDYMSDITNYEHKNFEKYIKETFGLE